MTAAMIYPLGSLWLKRAQQAGVMPWRACLYSNWIMSACFLPLLFFADGLPNLDYLLWPILAGVCFFAGQLFTILSVHHGDVSVQTPLMGIKTIFVALASTVWLRAETLSVGVWLAAGLTVIAVYLLGSGGGGQSKQGQTLGVLFAVISCVFFSATDSIVGAKGQDFSPIPLLLVLMGTLSTLSVFAWPLAAREAKPPAGSGRFVLLGGVAYGIQAAILGVALGFFGQATTTNIVYSIRGLVAIGLVWFIGQWFQNTERDALGPSVMARRLLGAVLMCAAIVLVMT